MTIETFFLSSQLKYFQSIHGESNKTSNNDKKNNDGMRTTGKVPMTFNQAQQTDAYIRNGVDFEKSWKNHLNYLSSSDIFVDHDNQSPSRESQISAELKNEFDVQYKAHEAKMKQDHIRNSLLIESERNHFMFVII